MRQVCQDDSPRPSGQCVQVSESLGTGQVFAWMRNRVTLGVRGGFLKERQEPAVRSALWAHDRS